MFLLGRLGAAIALVLALTILGQAAQARNLSWSELGIVARACKADHYAHCPGVPRGEGRVLACLKAHETWLQPVCQAVLPRVQAMAAQAT